MSVTYESGTPAPSRSFLARNAAAAASCTTPQPRGLDKEPSTWPTKQDPPSPDASVPLAAVKALRYQRRRGNRTDPTGLSERRMAARLKVPRDNGVLRPSCGCSPCRGGGKGRERSQESDAKKRQCKINNLEWCDLLEIRDTGVLISPESSSMSRSPDPLGVPTPTDWLDETTFRMILQASRQPFRNRMGSRARCAKSAVPNAYAIPNVCFKLALFNELGDGAIILRRPSGAVRKSRLQRMLYLPRPKLINLLTCSPVSSWA